MSDELIQQARVRPLPLQEAQGRPGLLPADREAASASAPCRWNARCVASARLLLALGNTLVIYLEPTLPPGAHGWQVWGTFGTIALLIGYAYWVWFQEEKREAPAYLYSLTPWLDILFSALLIASTGTYKSPFYVWNLFAVVGTALKHGWNAAVRACATAILLYVVLCLPGIHQPDFLLSVFLVRTLYLFVIALALAYMGQRLLEQTRSLDALHRAATHMSAGRSIPDLLARIADSTVELLESERVVVAAGEGEDDRSMALVNADPEQGERLLRLARAWVPAASPPHAALSLLSNYPGSDRRLQDAGEALAGVRNLLIMRLPGAHTSPGILVACNRHGRSGFTRNDQELADLLASQAGPLLETTRLQEQRRYHAGIDERRRIAAELHDGLIQTLASINLSAGSCSRMCRREQWEALPAELSQLQQLVEEAVDEARGAINELAPLQLREGRLAAYLEECLRQSHRRTGLLAVVSIELWQTEVPEPSALLLIGLLREGLNNIQKHARATEVSLVIQQKGDAVAFRLADNGIGFEKSPVLHAPTRHYGLAYLRERLAALGGELHVQSRPGHGAVLGARVPLVTKAQMITRLSQAQ
jgi:signal transduction histidine kinase